ncbi:hypothetical protein [Azospirillum sp. ST 5-10]|uniref:hypothetical protein n=1 Tax=unclassified Azospirillum TaxID=2630922 RepID=UPI003F4A7FCB
MSRAHYVVMPRTDGWYIHFEGNVYGPTQGGRTGALVAAVQAAQQAGKDGHEAQVSERSTGGTDACVWRFGIDAYPPAWAEDLRRDANVKPRGRSRPGGIA